jgi:hypothetical protein
MKTSSTRALAGSLFLLIVTLFITQFAACSGDELSSPTQLIRPFALRYTDGSVVYPVGQPVEREHESRWEFWAF